MRKKYRDNISEKYNEKLREILAELPDYCRYYFHAKAQNFEPKTRHAYAVDMKVFFTFMTERIPAYKGEPISGIPMEAFNQLTSHDIDEYMDYLRNYNADGDHRRNTEYGLARKLTSLRSFCKYYVQQHYIEKNPAEYAENPKIHKKDIITLSKEDKKKLLYCIESGYGMTTWQDTVNQYCRKRDKAILMLLLGTGIRVSELVGLNMEDIDLKDKRIHITRKGGNEGHVYFSDQVKDAILEYLRPSITPIGTRDALNPPPEERALFVSRKKTRLSVRAVEKIIERYKKLAFGEDTDRKITPHTMRKTYGTELYLQKEDIKLVSDTLGHKSINTTQQYYASTTEERRKQAAINVL